MHYAFFIFSLVLLLVVVLFLPETSHPGSRGVDKSNTRGLVWLNFFKSFWILQSPNIMSMVRPISFVCPDRVTVLIRLDRQYQGPLSLRQITVQIQVNLHNAGSDLILVP